MWTQGAGNTLVNKASSLCLTDPSSSTTNGQALDLATCTGAANQVWPLPTAPEPSSLIPDGPVYSPQFTSGGSSGQPLCLTESGTAVELTECVGGTSMQVSVESNGHLEINGLCLDTAGQGKGNGTAVVLDTCGTSTTQVWTQASPGQTVANQGAAGMCLNPPSVKSGTDLDIGTCSSSSNTEKWRLPTM